MDNNTIINIIINSRITNFQSNNETGLLKLIRKSVSKEQLHGA